MPLTDDTTYQKLLAQNRAIRGWPGEVDAVMAVAAFDIEAASATGETRDALAAGRRLVADLDRLLAEFTSGERAPNIDQPSVLKPGIHKGEYD